jgi:Na+/proline symporter
MELAVLGLLFAVALVHAILNFKRVSLDQYLHNGRETSVLFTAASAVAGNVGAGTVLGIFAFAAHGKGVAFFISLCYAVGLALTALLSKRIYERNHALGANSFIDFLVLYFGEGTRMAVWIAVGAVFFLQMASQLLALSEILSATMPLTRGQGILFAYAFVTVYLLSGGYSSVTKMDCLQFVFIFLSALCIYAFLDWPVVLRNAEQIYTPQRYGAVFIAGIFLFLAPSAVVSIDNWHRVISAKDADTARKAFFITAALCFLVYCSYALLGLLAPAGATEPVTLMRRLFPPFLSFFGVLSLVAAVVSTMDATILPLAAPVCGLAKKRPLTAMRLTVFGIMTSIALVAYFLSSVVSGLIAALSSLAALFPGVLTALRGGRPSALALTISLPAAILGALVFVKVNEEYAFLVGIGLSFTLYYAISAWDFRRQDAAAGLAPEME